MSMKKPYRSTEVDHVICPKCWHKLWQRLKFFFFTAVMAGLWHGFCVAGGEELFFRSRQSPTSSSAVLLTPRSSANDLSSIMLDGKKAKPMPSPTARKRLPIDIQAENGYSGSGPPGAAAPHFLVAATPVTRDMRGTPTWATNVTWTRLIQATSFELYINGKPRFLGLPGDATKFRIEVGLQSGEKYVVEVRGYLENGRMVLGSTEVAVPNEELSRS